MKRLATKHAIVTPYTASLVVEEEELDRMRSANPLFVSGPRRARGGGPGGQYRGPGGSVPPGLREPADPTPPPSSPPTTPPPVPPPTTPAPGGPAAPPVPATPSAPQRSKDLAREKERSAGRDEAHVRLVAGRTFRKEKDGRWVDTAWDGQTEPTRVEAFSAAWDALATKGGKVAKILALGERILFVLEDTVYEIVPPEAE